MAGGGGRTETQRDESGGFSGGSQPFGGFNAGATSPTINPSPMETPSIAGGLPDQSNAYAALQSAPGMEYAQNTPPPAFNFQDIGSGGISSLPNPFESLQNQGDFQPANPFGESSGYVEPDYNFPIVGNQRERGLPWRNTSGWGPGQWLNNRNERFLYSAPGSNQVRRNTPSNWQRMVLNRNRGTGGR